MDSQRNANGQRERPRAGRRGARSGEKIKVDVGEAPAADGELTIDTQQPLDTFDDWSSLNKAMIVRAWRSGRDVGKLRAPRRSSFRTRIKIMDESFDWPMSFGAMA
jgi:hypothetical protein